MDSVNCAFVWPVYFFVVSFPRGWWRGGVWQHCEWWSPLPTLPLHWGYWHHEEGKAKTHTHTHSLAHAHKLYVTNAALTRETLNQSDTLTYSQSDSWCFTVIATRHFVFSCVCVQLLRRNPERRLGSGEKDAEEVKKQPFFRVSRLKGT